MTHFSLFMTQILRRSSIYKTQSNVFENLKLKNSRFYVLSRKHLILNVSWCVYRRPFKI